MFEPTLGPPLTKAWGFDSLLSTYLILCRPEFWTLRCEVVAQLAERSLLTSQIGGSNPNIGNKVFSNVLIRPLQWRKDKNKETEARLKKSQKWAQTYLDSLQLYSPLAAGRAHWQQNHFPKRVFSPNFNVFDFTWTLLGSDLVFRREQKDLRKRQRKEGEGIKLEMEKEKNVRNTIKARHT